MRIAPRLGWIGVCALCAGACGSDDSNSESEDPAAHACEQVAATSKTVTASDTRENAPPIAPSEEPYTVTLAAGGPSYLEIGGGIDALLFSKDSGVVIGLYREQETQNQLPPPEPNAACPGDIPEHFDLALGAAGAWYLELAPAATASVWLALTEASGHAH